MSDETNRPDLPAGSFSTWLRATRAAQRDRSDVDVPCGDCTACCTSSYFIHVAPDETETLQRIPKALLFNAPGLPEGHRVMGYDENGHCPMLVDGHCSIYAHRPRTCRSYDCRVFAAAGIEAGGAEKEKINQRALRWRFRFDGEIDRIELSAVQAAAVFLREHADRLPAGLVPSNPTQLALLALEIYDVFLDHSQTSTASEIEQTVLARLADRGTSRPA